MNIYSTVVLHGDTPTTITVDNRHDFTDLSSVNFTWRMPGVANGVAGVGTVQGACPPRATGCKLSLSGLPSGAQMVEVNATSPRGFLINRWIVGSIPVPPAPGSATTVHLQRHLDGSAIITVGSLTWAVDTNGSVSASFGGASSPVVARGPTVMALAVDGSTSTQLTEANDMSYGPWTDPLDGWVVSGKPTYSQSGFGAAVVANVSGSYGSLATASFGLVFDGSQGLSVDVFLEWHGPKRDVRQFGVVFDLPRGVESLSWVRRTQWSVYPPDAMGRPRGVGVTPKPSTEIVPCPDCPEGPAIPTHAWKDDTTPLGSNDFRGTKANATFFELCGSGGTGCFAMSASASQGDRHGRAWLNQNSPFVSVLAASVSSEGGNPFSAERVLPGLTLSPGSHADVSFTFSVAKQTQMPPY